MSISDMGDQLSVRLVLEELSAFVACTDNLYVRVKFFADFRQIPDHGEARAVVYGFHVLHDGAGRTPSVGRDVLVAIPATINLRRKLWGKASLILVVIHESEELGSDVAAVGAPYMLEALVHVAIKRREVAAFKAAAH